MEIHRGSSSARSASEKLTLCFSKLTFALPGSHVQRIRPSVYTKLYLQKRLPVNQLLAAPCDHLRGVLEAGVGDRGPGQHTGDFVGAGTVIENADLGFGAAVILTLFDN